MVLAVVQGVAKAGVRVLFHCPDGSLAGDVTTGAGGGATFNVVSGAMATVVFLPEQPTPGAASRLTTIQGLEPGDVVMVTDDLVSDAVLASAMLPGPFAGAQSYVVDFGCGAQASVPSASVGSPAMASVDPGCFGWQGRMSLVARAVGALAYTGIMDVPLTTPFVTLGPWRTDVSAFALSVTNAPAATTEVDVTAGITGNGAVFHLDDPQTMPLAAGGGATFQFPSIPQAFGDAVYFDLTLKVGTSSGGRSSTLGWHRQDPTFPTGLAVDLTQTSLPVILNVVDQSTDPTRPDFTWQQVGAGAGTPDAIVVAMSFDQNHTWRVLAPPTRAEVKLPELPASLALTHPVAGSQVQTRIAAFEADWLSSYAQVKGEGAPNLLAPRLPSGPHLLRTSQSF
jgi:hypothetical protein